METKTCLKDATLTLKDNTLILERKKGFFSLDTSRTGGGIREIRSIITYSLNSPEDPAMSDPVQSDEILKNMSKVFKVLEPSTITIGNYDIKKGINKTVERVTAIVTAGKSIHMPLNITVLMDWKLDEIALIELFQSITEVKTAIFCDFGVKNFYLDRNFYKDTNFKPLNDEITVACTGHGDKNSMKEMGEIRLMVTKCISEAIEELLKNFGYPQDILGHIENAGVTIEDLINAGMQLCVGVERTEELDSKLKKQILKSLEDLNVVALIIAGIRLDEDFSSYRIRGIDVDDDPAYLYSDEVLGMAVANQIAGTKAIFNFKRYDEEKPGIIGVLGPVLDDIFAGLVAGCMSKIFEE